jgi:hypothetical protein
LAKKTAVSIKGVGQAQKAALDFLRNQSTDKRIFNQIGSELALQIQRRTTAKLDEYKQKPLTESTIISREIMAEANQLSEFSKPKQSNLTLSGQLLGAIRNKFDSASATIIIFLNNSRNKLQPPTKESINKVAASKSKSKRGGYYAIGNLILNNPQKNKTNNQIKSDLEDQGRKFLFMSAKLKIQLEKNITSQLRKQLTLFNKIKRKLSL